MQYPVSDAGSRLHNGKFHNGDAELGIPSSVDKATHMNAVYDEIIAVIAAATLTPSESNNTQLLAALNFFLALKANLASPAFSGNPTVPTQLQSDNSTRIANTSYVRTAIANLINSSPGVLDTLNELAAALGNDPNFATTMVNALAGKANKTGIYAGLSVGWADGAGNANTVGGYHASQLWRNDQATSWGSASNGGFRLPNGRVFQYTLVNFNGVATNPRAFSFPAAFPNYCSLVTATAIENASEVNVASVIDTTNTTFTLRRTAGNEYAAYFIFAIGG